MKKIIVAAILTIIALASVNANAGTLPPEVEEKIEQGAVKLCMNLMNMSIDVRIAESNGTPKKKIVSAFKRTPTANNPVSKAYSAEAMKMIDDVYAGQFETGTMLGDCKASLKEAVYSGIEK